MSADAPQLLYTSAPEGLERGAVGFCVVAATPGLPRGAAAAAESLSGYRHAGPPGDPANPVVLMHVKLARNSGRAGRVLVRVNDAGRDYTGRQNKLARLAFVGAPPPNCGPAAALAAPPFSGEAWDGKVGELPPWTPPADRPAGVCKAWARAGEVGWAGVLAAGVSNGDRSPVALILPPDGGDESSRLALELFAEAIALLPPARRWDATFTTHDGPRPAGAECRWRAAAAGTAEAKALRRLRGATVLDLTNPAALAAALPATAALQPAIAAARAGRPLGGAGSEAAAASLAAPDTSNAAPASGVIFAEGASLGRPEDSRSARTSAPPRSRANTPPPLPGGRSRKGLWIGAASAAVLLLVVGVGVAVTLSQPELLTKWTGTPGEAEAVGANATSSGTKDGTAAVNDGAADPALSAPATPEETDVVQAPADDAAPEGDDGADRDRQTPQADANQSVLADNKAAAPTAAAMADTAANKAENDGRKAEQRPDTEPDSVPAEAPPAPPTLVRAPIDGAIEGNTLRTRPLDQPIKTILGGPLSKARLWLPATLMESHEEFRRGTKQLKDGELVQGFDGIKIDKSMSSALHIVLKNDGGLSLSSTLNINELTEEQATVRASAAVLTPEYAENVEKGIAFGDLFNAVPTDGEHALSKRRLIVSLNGEIPTLIWNDVNLQATVRLKGEEQTRTVPAVFRGSENGSDDTLEATVFDETAIQQDAESVAGIAEAAQKALNAFNSDPMKHRLQRGSDEARAGQGGLPPFIPPSYKEEEVANYAGKFEAEMETIILSLNKLAEDISSENPPSVFPDQLRWKTIEKRVMPWKPRLDSLAEGQQYDPKRGREPPKLRESLAAVQETYGQAKRRTSGRVTKATFFYRVRAVPTEQEEGTMENQKGDQAKLPPDANVILLHIGEDPPEVPPVTETDSSN